MTNPERVGYIYVLHNKQKHYWKFGISTVSPGSRFGRLFRATPFEFDVRAIEEGTGESVRKVERAIHDLPYIHPFIGTDEPFEGFTEWLICESDDVLKKFRIMCEWHGLKRIE